MTKAFELPLAVSKNLYSQSLAEGLGEICVPLKMAQPGDIVAMKLEFMADDADYEIMPLCDLLYLEDKDSLFLKSIPFHELPADRQAKVGPAMMTIQSKGLYAMGFIPISSRITRNPVEKIYYEMIAAPKMALVQRDAYPMEVLENRFQDGDICQNDIDSCILAVHTSLPTTAHETIEQCSDYEQLLKLANANTPMPGPKDIHEEKALTLPSLIDIPTL